MNVVFGIFAKYIRNSCSLVSELLRCFLGGGVRNFDFSLDQSILWIYFYILLLYEGELLFSATDINSWECLKEVREFTWILNTVGFDWEMDGGIFSLE